MTYSIARMIGDKIADWTIVRFAAVGLVTTALDFTVLNLLAGPAGLSPAPANTISYSCGIAVSFVLNRVWTFGHGMDGPRIGRHGLLFIVSNMIGLLLSTLAVSLLSRLMPLNLAKAVSVPVVFFWNYAAARFWVFK